MAPSRFRLKSQVLLYLIWSVAQEQLHGFIPFDYAQRPFYVGDPVPANRFPLAVKDAGVDGAADVTTAPFSTTSARNTTPLR